MQNNTVTAENFVYQTQVTLNGYQNNEKIFYI